MAAIFTSGIAYIGSIICWWRTGWARMVRSKARAAAPATSTDYRLPTKQVNEQSIDLVVKYCRVAEDVLLDTMTFNRFANAEFNRPYEEFSLVMDLRFPSP
jgi:hypothetical protein